MFESIYRESKKSTSIRGMYEYIPRPNDQAERNFEFLPLLRKLI